MNNKCPVCLLKSDKDNYFIPNNPNELVIDCPNCNPEEFGKFYIGKTVFEKLNTLNSNQRQSMSKRIKENIFEKENKILIDSDNFDKYSTENKW